MSNKLHAIALILGVIAGNSFAMAFIISDFDGNGDFESGVASPWEGCTVVSNGEFALHGHWYAQTFPPMSHAEVFQYRAPSTPRPDLVYYLSFYTRSGNPGYPIVYGSLAAKREDGSFIHADILESNQVPITGTEWTLNEYICSFGGIPDESLSLKTSIHFEGGETNSEAFVDLVFLFADLSSTRLAGLTATNEAVTLTINHLAPTNRYWVQCNTTLATDGWISVGEIELTTRTTHWSEAISNQWNKAFYRLWKE